MKKIGVIKEMDKLGGLVIPKKMREMFGIEKTVEIVITEEGILIRSPEYKLVEREKK